MSLGEFRSPVKSMTEANYIDIQKDGRNLNMGNYS